MTLVPLTRCTHHKLTNWNNRRNNLLLSRAFFVCCFFVVLFFNWIFFHRSHTILETRVMRNREEISDGLSIALLMLAESEFQPTTTRLLNIFLLFKWPACFTNPVLRVLF